MADGGGDAIFVYTGGAQDVPEDVTHVVIDKSVKIIPARAFHGRRNLVSVEMHDDLEIIEEFAFDECPSLRGIKLPSVRVIEKLAFYNCRAMTEVEFGDKLETIGGYAFAWTALRNIKLPKVRAISVGAFDGCQQLTDAELSEGLESLGGYSFENCPRLRRIAIPLKDDMFEDDTVFHLCVNLSRVDLVGGIHKTISSLHLQSRRNEMIEEIDRINQVLPNIAANGYNYSDIQLWIERVLYRNYKSPNAKTTAIRRWMRTVLERITHYKSEHYALLKEAMTLLELALWKAKLDEVMAPPPEKTTSSSCRRCLTLLSMTNTKEKAKVDVKAARQEARVQRCCADVIIKNVLSFLNDDDVFPFVMNDDVDIPLLINDDVDIPITM